jgi:hypothetical protein
MPPSFKEEVESGDRMRALVALRGELATAIEDCTDAGDLSSLALRLTRVLEQIHELGGPAAKKEPDVLAERRKAKLSAAADA